MAKGLFHMSIIGQKVHHTSWGQGVIIDQTEVTVSVQFHALPDSQQVKRLVFPDAFIKGHLIGADSQAIVAIENTLSERKCSICGKTNVRTKLIDEKRICSLCQPKLATVCVSCNEYYLSKQMLPVYDIENPYSKKMVCKTCANNNSFICERCNSRYLIENKAPKHLTNRTLCNSCFNEILRVCYFCESVFDVDKGASVYGKNGRIHVCPDCLDEQTFICSVCGSRELKSSVIDSKYVPASKNVCSFCISYCDSCGEEIVIDHKMNAFGKWFCPDCWEKSVKECIICGEKYLPNPSQKKICPDCIEMESYISRLKEVNYLNGPYKNLKYYSLEYTDRCELFTNLYKSCGAKTEIFFSKEIADPFYYLVLDLFRYKIVVTYISRKVVGNVKFSENVTMTEFRSNKGKYNVREAIARWASDSSQFMEISAGKMRILDYPVLLRVQTSFDKVYGKQWNGPDDYIEIGNYGDTTDFYMIGILEE